MNELSEAGKLYLEDYALLTSARRELEQFLKSICDHLAKDLESRKGTLVTPKGFQWIVQNVGKGAGEVELRLQERNSPGNRPYMFLRYLDVRYDEEVLPGHAGILIGTIEERYKLLVSDKPRLERAIAVAREHELELDFSDKQNHPHYDEPQLDLSSAQKTATSIAELMAKRANALGRFVESMASSKG